MKDPGPQISAASARDDDPREAPPGAESPRRWLLALLLMAATFVTMLAAGAGFREGGGWPGSLAELASGWTFAVPMMAILLTHELGHYLAARIHRVPVSPPYFLPVPLFLGTLGAVLLMPARIKSRAALLDIGAAGPLAGLLVAVPVLAFGLVTSPVAPVEPDHLIEGRSILYLGLRAAVKGAIPPGQDVLLSPTAVAGWGGLLVTMMNLVPVGQLDGGHVAYALFGPRQDRWSARVHRSLPLVGLAVSLGHGWAAVNAGGALIDGLLAGIHWVIWAGVLALLLRASGPRHPPTDPGPPLDPARRLVGALALLVFGLLFMPSWIRLAGP